MIPGWVTKIRHAAEQLRPSAEVREAHTPQWGHSTAETLKKIFLNFFKKEKWTFSFEMAFIL